MKTDLFQSCGHCWVFQICCRIEYSTFTASSFRIWNSSTGIPSPPLALFLVILPKAPLTSHSRMTGSRLAMTPSWLSELWRSFLYSSVYSCHLFLISSASVRSIPFLSFIEPVFAWNVPLVSHFLEEIPSLSYYIVFLYFFALITLTIKTTWRHTALLEWYSSLSLYDYIYILTNVFKLWGWRRLFRVFWTARSQTSQS